MRKQIAIVLLFMLLFAGLGSSALVARSFAGAKPLTLIQREKRLGPKPPPHSYCGWLPWRLTKSGGHRVRPGQAPRRVPRWAWRRFHFFQLARARVAVPRGATAQASETYEQAIAYTLKRPSFSAARTILVSNAAEL